jgi:hypothetical protein
VRYLPNGSLDSSFDGDGKLLLATLFARFYGLALQTDGKIVTTGSEASRRSASRARA